MTFTPDPEETARLDALANQAQNYALHMMRTTGSVPATVIADTKEGFVFCVPAGLPDEAAKDQFADVARLLAVAHGARAIAMVVEAWVRLAKPVRSNRPDGLYRSHFLSVAPPPPLGRSLLLRLAKRPTMALRPEERVIQHAPTVRNGPYAGDIISVDHIVPNPPGRCPDRPQSRLLRLHVGRTGGGRGM